MIDMSRLALEGRGQGEEFQEPVSLTCPCKRSLHARREKCLLYFDRSWPIPSNKKRVHRYAALATVTTQDQKRASDRPRLRLRSGSGAESMVLPSMFFRRRLRARVTMQTAAAAGGKPPLGSRPPWDAHAAVVFVASCPRLVRLVAF